MSNLFTQVDRIKFETVKTVNNPGFYSINTGINPGVNKKNIYKLNRFNGFLKPAVNLSHLNRRLEFKSPFFLENGDFLLL
jgi:hypothetical protein